MKTLEVQLSERAWSGLQNYITKHQIDPNSILEALGCLLADPNLAEQTAWAVWQSTLEHTSEPQSKTDILDLMGAMTKQAPLEIEEQLQNLRSAWV